MADSTLATGRAAHSSFSLLELYCPWDLEHRKNLKADSSSDEPRFELSALRRI